VKIDRSGQLPDGLIGPNYLAHPCFSPEERKWYGTDVDIEDRNCAESLVAVEKRILEMVG
jgi:hypothetical protein